jgi:hypothetical protein
MKAKAVLIAANSELGFRPLAGKWDESLASGKEGNALISFRPLAGKWDERST